MKILFDTNVVLDILLNRKPFAFNAIALFSVVENKKIHGFLCATTITTIEYLCTKSIGKNKTKQTVASLLQLFSIAEVNQKVLIQAVNSNFTDFEDAVLYQSGLIVGVDGLVTRNKKDFVLANYPIYSPDELCKIIIT